MKKVPFFISLFAGFIIILISIYGFFLLRHRPDFPPINDIFTDLPTEMTIKDIIREENMDLQIDSIEIDRAMDIEFILSQKTIGEWATFSLMVNDKIEEKEAQLIPFYSRAPFPLIYFSLSLGHHHKQWILLLAKILALFAPRDFILYSLSFGSSSSSSFFFCFIERQG